MIDRRMTSQRYGPLASGRISAVRLGPSVHDGEDDAIVPLRMANARRTGVLACLDDGAIAGLIANFDAKHRLAG
ncbi:hypothetical protein [Loktanella fryxellensis]|uniref:hypothetical protein n=1 Tax=Loktanella fryxellensis TaxID=245187 RepID=UPI00115FA555|nr:hypothetical protein [Loktanella fryxellensis]